MLAALTAIYAVAESVLGAVVISVTLGVHQGSPTSCQLFIIYVNDLIKMIKDGAGVEGFLSWLPILVLMNDTALVATTLPNMIKKITLVKKYCDEYGMEMNLAEANFLSLNVNRVIRNRYT